MRFRCMGWSHDHSGVRRRDVLDTVHALQSGAIVEEAEKRQQARLVTRLSTLWYY
jgi:hypothetical protein